MSRKISEKVDIPNLNKSHNDINNMEDETVQERFSSDTHLHNDCTSDLPEDYNTHTSDKPKACTIKEYKNNKNDNNKENEEENVNNKQNEKNKIPLAPIFFNYEKGIFENIPDDQLRKWQKEYPGIEITKQLRKAKGWLLQLEDQATKGDKSFLERWFDRALEKADPYEALAREYDQTGKV
jgi:hypothetical protein